MSATLVEDTRTTSLDEIEATAASSRPTRNEVINAICYEAFFANVDCNAEIAGKVLYVVDRGVQEWRKVHKTVSIEIWDANTFDKVHDVLKVIMPDGVATPRVNSAHDLLNLHILHPGECAIHTKTQDGKFCAVRVNVTT